MEEKKILNDREKETLFNSLDELSSQSLIDVIYCIRQLIEARQDVLRMKILESKTEFNILSDTLSKSAESFASLHKDQSKLA